MIVPLHFLLLFHRINCPVSHSFAAFFLFFFQGLKLFFNAFSGTIPSELGLLANTLRAWGVSNNALTGTIPTELGLLTLTGGFHVNHNKLTGPLPSGKSIGSRRFSNILVW